MELNLLPILEWSGCLLSILGSFLLARNDRRSRYGFVAFLFANVLWFGYAVMTEAPGLALQQIAFTATSIYGIRTWFGRQQPQANTKASTCDLSC